MGFITYELCGSVSGKVTSFSSAIKAETAVIRLCPILQGFWDTPNLTLFLGFEPVGVAPTAAIPEMLANLLLLVIVPFQDVILAVAFHWMHKTRTHRKTNAEIAEFSA